MKAAVATSGIGAAGAIRKRWAGTSGVDRREARAPQGASACRLGRVPRGGLQHDHGRSSGPRRERPQLVGAVR